MVILNIKKCIKLCFGANDKKIPDPKSVEQTMVNRFALGAIVLMLSILFFPNNNIINSFIIYLIVNCIMWITLDTKAISANMIILSGIILDTGMGVYISTLNAADMAIVYPIYLWSILGIGFRFGNRWLFIASFISMASFGTIIYTQPYWQQNLSFSISLLVSLFAIPAYCSILISKLSQAKEKAETANRAKSYFLASVSHELRTPLNAIIGYGTHLSDMNLSPSQLKMVNSSVAAGQYLLQLIEQLLQLGRTQTQYDAIELSDFKITDLLVDSRDMLIGKANEKGLELLIQSEPDCHGIYNGPENDIKNIVLNITSNAIKFTEQGKIVIRSSIAKQGNDISLLLSITDTGIGIEQHAIEKIFEPFQQADDTIMDRFGGTGLGLAICKQIVDKLKGSIIIDSQIGKGSCFKISIPLVSELENETNNNDPISPLTRIISLGHQKEDILLKAQCSGNYYISHRECNSIDDIKSALEDVDLDEFEVALFDQAMVGELESTDPFWQAFKQYSIACILISDDEEIDIHEIGIKSAFASILSPATSFDQFRKAINIGASFADIHALDFDKNNFRVNDDKNMTDNVSIDEERETITNGLNILVVDDNRTNRMVLESILSSQNFNVDLANDGDEALEQLEDKKYDIMLIDVNMPRMNGIEATRLWRSIENPENPLPILGVTADATDETLEKCLAAGMNERITKPVEAKSLIEKVIYYTQNKTENSVKNPPISEQNTYNNQQSLTAINNVIDMSRIKYLESIGDGDFIRLVIDSYIDETRQIAETFHIDERLCNHEQFRFAVHAIKSSANNIGATKLSALCAEYENLSEHKYNSNAQNYIVTVTDELVIVEKSIRDVQKFYYPRDQLINADISSAPMKYADSGLK